jgi:hypothetical protein
MNGDPLKDVWFRIKEIHAKETKPIVKLGLI